MAPSLSSRDVVLYITDRLSRRLNILDSGFQSFFFFWSKHNLQKQEQTVTQSVKKHSVEFLHSLATMPSKGRFNANRTSLASSLDRKVEAIVRRFAEEKSKEENITTQRSLRLPLAQIYQYVQGADPSFQRMKKPQLEKSVDKALAVLNAEEDEEDASFDSDFEGLQEDTLMEVKVSHILQAQT